MAFLIPPGPFVGLDQGNQLAKDTGDVAPIYFINEQSVALNRILPSPVTKSFEQTISYFIADAAFGGGLGPDSFHEVLVAVRLVEGHCQVAFDPRFLVLRP